MQWILFSLSLRYEFTKAGIYTFTLSSGKYTFHCYGAQGGDGIYDFEISPTIGLGGKGAHVLGTLSINGSGTLFYLNVGGEGEQGNSKQNKGGINGGGKAGFSLDSASRNNLSYSGGGGGATDIRVETNNLANRIMVAQEDQVALVITMELQEAI